MRGIFFVIIGLSFFIPYFSAAQGKFAIDAQFRPRSEFRNGYTTLPEMEDRPVFITSQRTRLNLSYTHDEHLSGYISVQDVRIWGEDAQLDQTADLNIYQAWLRFQPARGVYLQLGRQELEYDNYKLMGKANWRQQGRTHDAALMGLKSADSTITANFAIAINEDDQSVFRDLYESRNYKNLQLIWLNKRFVSGEASLIFVNRGLEKPDTSVSYMQTLGFFGRKDQRNWTFTGSYYHQFGENVTDQDVDAWMASFDATCKVLKKIKITAGFDILSGTRGADLNDPDYDETNTFIPLYARRHRYFGRQDMFYFGGFDVPPGLKDLYLKVYDQIHEKWSLGIEAHSFSTHRSLLDTGGEGMDKDLGIELDALFLYKYNDFFSVSGGYLQYFATDTMVALKQRGDKSELTNFFYVTFDFTPKLLN